MKRGVCRLRTTHPGKADLTDGGIIELGEDFSKTVISVFSS